MSYIGQSIHFLNPYQKKNPIVWFLEVLKNQVFENFRVYNKYMYLEIKEYKHIKI